MKSALTATRTEIITVQPSIQERLANRTWDGRLAWRRYGSMVEGNFVHWLLSTYLRSLCLPTKDVLLANLRDEVEANHTGLLRTLLSRNSLLPSFSDQEYVSGFMARIRALCATGDPGILLAFLAILESSSYYFLPAMARRAGISAEDPYIIIHLEADQDHAAQLLQALQSERDQGSVSSQAIEEGIQLADSFFGILFDLP